MERKLILKLASLHDSLHRSVNSANHQIQVNNNLIKTQVTVIESSQGESSYLQNLLKAIENKLN